MKMKAKHGDIALAGVSVVLGIVIMILTRVQNLPFSKNGMPGSGMFPTLCAIAIIICGLLLLFEVHYGEKKLKESGGEHPDSERTLFNPAELRSLLIFAIMGGLILVLSRYLGLLTCLCLSIIAYIKIEGKDPLWKAAVIGVGAIVFLYAVFVMFLHVPVPKGPLGF